MFYKCFTKSPSVKHSRRNYYGMPTVKEIVLKHHVKEKGACNVKIRLTHKRKSIYFDTSYYVSAKQLKSDLSIKDTFILRQVLNEVEEYRLKLNELGPRCELFDVKQLAEVLNSKEIKPEEVNIISTFNLLAFRRIQQIGLTQINSRGVVRTLSGFFF